MGFRGDPQTTEEHFAYVYELLRRLRLHTHPVVTVLDEGGFAVDTDCPCPVTIRICVPGAES